MGIEALSEASVDQDARLQSIENLELEKAASVAALLERAQMWCSQQRFNLTAVKKHFDTDATVNMPSNLKALEMSVSTSRPNIVISRSSSASGADLGYQPPTIYLFPCCRCKGCPSAGDEPELRSPLIRIHIVHHLRLQLIFGVGLCIWYAASAWFQSEHLCPCPVGEYWYCIFGDTLKRSDQQPCQPEDVVIRKCIASFALMLYVAILLRVAFTVERMIKPLKMWVQLNEEKNEAKRLKATIKSIQAENQFVALMIHWRTSTIPRLYLMDWAFYQFRETNGLVLDGVTPSLLSTTLQASMCQSVSNLTWLFNGLSMPSHIEFGSSRYDMAVVLQFRDSVADLRKRALCSGICDLFTPWGEISQLSHLPPQLQNVEKLQFNQDPPTMSMLQAPSRGRINSIQSV